MGTKVLFQTGTVVTTPGALDFMNENEINMLDLLLRHISGDDGDLSDEDKAENKLSIIEGFRILSAYNFDAGKVWIITENDRSVTTFLLPTEY